MSNLTRQEQRAWEQWLELREHISNSTTLPESETPEQQRARVNRLKGDFAKFCAYYFPHYVLSPFGWFHKRAAKEIEKDPATFAVLEWPREHAKSVFADVLMPLYLKARGELSGMIIASANGDKAAGLLGDIQAELMSNRRYAHDFGQQYALGKWSDGNFSTTDGCGFWAFGRGQSPRGTREGAKRPNYCVVDDIDDAQIVKNEARVREAVDWVLGDLFGALSIDGGRMIIAGNRIHAKGILAHLVGDVEPEDPVREGIYHLKVYAIETRRHQKASADNGRPAWKERYTLEKLADKMAKMGYRNARREFFHEHIVEGHVFKNEQVIWAKLPKLWEYEDLVSYCDPSFKGTKKNDFKSIVLVGRHKQYYDVLWVWLRQTTPNYMAAAHYDLHEWIQSQTDRKKQVNVRHYMEDIILQDLLIAEYDQEALSRGYTLPLRPDRRKKPDKFGRIENLSPFWERGLFRFNADYRQAPDMRTLVDQFLSFPTGHDDGPDSVEGAIIKLNKRSRASKTSSRAGSYRKNRNRRL